MRVLVCGGRDYRDRDKVFEVMNRLDDEAPYPGIRLVISGGAPGADTYAIDWTLKWDTQVAVFHADWKAHGRAAGPIRNQRMIDEGKPNLVLAFPGGRGTADMVRRARAAGIEVREIEE